MTEPRAVRTLQTPRKSGEALIEPPFGEVAALLAQNATFPLGQVAVFDRSLSDLAASARANMLESAVRYTRQYRNAPSIPAQPPPRIVVAGHQPELFHPGVWFKNFVLDRLARRNDAVAVNLLIDNDTCRQASIRVPTGSIDRPTAELVAFDAARPAVAWEERQIADTELFRTFGERAANTVRPLVSNPLVDELWPLAIEAAGRGATLGAAIAQGRHAYEGALGLSTLELPLSEVCRGEAFLWFAAWLIEEAPRVRSVYNAAVQAYRAANRIRSAAHPVPDLTIEDHRDGNYIESPLWVWSQDDPRRRHLFVARRADRLLLTDREHWNCEIQAVGDGSPQRTIEQLHDLGERGIRLRPRALTNTWYARVALGDFFVHGIGGAKYDEVTDRIIAELFGISPPAYLTATATLRLPIAHTSRAESRLRSLAARRRDLQFHPETAASRDDPTWLAAIREKERCIDDFRAAAPLEWNRDEARRRHEAIVRANAAFAPWIASELQALAAEEAALDDRLRGDRLLDSREHAFCLFPRDAIAPQLAALAGV
jgi:hypothetical protein